MNIKTFPVFMVKGSDGKPCGHQHQHQEQAENCASNAATRERGRTFSVIKYERLDVPAGIIDADYTSQSPVSHFEASLVKTEIELS